MVKLTYITNMSLDGYIEDRHGAFDFGPMDDDLSRRWPAGRPCLS
jgi:hypothetical protein